LADLRTILQDHGHHAELRYDDLHSTSFSMYLSTDALASAEADRTPGGNAQEASVYFMETGDDLLLDTTIDAYFAQLLTEQPAASAFCSHCYAHFTPTIKPFDVRHSDSCALSLPRSDPELSRLFDLPNAEYLATFHPSGEAKGTP